MGARSANAAIGSTSNAADASGLPALARGYEEGVRAVNLHVLDKVARRAIPAEAAEGWYLMARLRGVPELNEVVVKLRGSLDLGDDLAKEAGDKVLARTGSSTIRALTQSSDNALSVRKACKNACAPLNDRLREHVAPFVGRNADGSPGPFETMAEFEFLRTIPIKHLDLPQRQALKVIRQQMEEAAPISWSTPLRKFVPAADFEKYRTGFYDPTVRGFIARAEDTQDLVAAGRISVRDNLGLDYRTADGSANPFNAGGGYAVIDFPQAESLAQHVRVPKSAEGWAGGLDTYVELPAPNTGIGIVGGADGVLRRENHLGRVLVPREVNGQIMSVFEDAARDMPLGTTITLRSDTGAAISKIRLQRNAENELAWVFVEFAP